MNTLVVLAFVFIIIKYIDKNYSFCSEEDSIEYRYIPRNINHHFEDSSFSTNDTIKSMTDKSANIWLNKSKVT